MFKIGTVSKYYEKTGMCIVNLISDLSLDDSTQPKIEYIQIGFKKVSFAPKGETVAIKFNEKIKEGSEIFSS